MAFYHYYQLVHGDKLPDTKWPLSATIPQQAIAEVNKQVQEAANTKASKRGSYGRFNVKTRAVVVSDCSTILALQVSQLHLADCLTKRGMLQSRKGTPKCSRQRTELQVRMWLVLRTLFNVTYVRTHVPGKIMVYVQRHADESNGNLMQLMNYIRKVRTTLSGRLVGEQKEIHICRHTECNLYHIMSCVVWWLSYTNQYFLQLRLKTQLRSIRGHCKHSANISRSIWESPRNICKSEPDVMFSNRGEIFAWGAMFV